MTGMMKKLILIPAILLIIMTACTEDEIISYTPSNLYGTWDQFAPPASTEGYDSIYHIFTGTQYKIRYFKNDTISGEVAYEYEFDGQSFIYESGSEIVNDINTLNDTLLSFTTNALGTEETVECLRVQ